MAMTVSELQVKVTADTSQAESGLASLGSKVTSVGGAVATAFGGAAVAGVVALGGALAASVASAATFEQSMSAIKAVSGATAPEMEQLSALALQLGADTSFSASEAADGIGELVKAGVSIGDVMGGGAAAALNLAAAGGLSVAESASIASNAMNVFSLKGADVGHVADVIAGAANASAIDVHDFGLSLAASGSVAATVGIGLDDLGTAIAVMGQAGIKGSDAGTSLKTMLLNLTPATKQQLAVSKELGITTADGANKFFDATGKAKSMSEIAEVLKTSTAGLTEQQKLQALQTLFGTDAIRAAAIMAKAGAEGFDTMAESIGKVTAADVAKTRLDNLKGSIEQLKGSLETAGIELGTMLLPGLKSMVDGLTTGVNAGIDIIKQLPDAWGDVVSIFTENATAGNLESLLSQLGLSEAAVTTIDDMLANLGDAWRTMQQAFAGDWSPSNQIDPFVEAVGKATLTVKDLGSEVDRLGSELSGLGGAFGNMTSAFGSGTGVVDLLLADFKLMTLTVGEIIDVLISAGRAAMDFAGVASALGRALGDLATGDVPAAREAMISGNAAMADLMATGEEFASRTSARVGEGMQAIASVTGSSMSETQSAVETSMTAAAAATDTGMASVASSVETQGAAAVSAMDATGTGMAGAMEAAAPAITAAADTAATGVVTAVEGQTPAATAAADAMGTGMASGIEAAAPQMAAAAEQGASGAVAAVQAQQGAASGAGQSVGDALGSGMQGGILGWAGRVAAAAVNVVSQAIGAARAAADAQSPSKKMQKLGEDMAEGLAIGLTKSGLGEEMQAQIRDFIDASRDYIPVAGQIAQVESRIKQLRDEGQTAALFRAQEMITIDSEALRLKSDLVNKEREQLRGRQDLAAASRDVANIERGTLADRTQLIEMDGQRKTLRLQEIDLEKQLIGLDSGSKRAQTIQAQIDKLRDQDRALSLEGEKITLNNSIASTASRVRQEGLADQVRGYDDVTLAIKNEIERLGGEQAAFSANEAIIKNATDNEVGYRQRLIAVFTAEGKPLADRITAGLKLVEQLHNEGKISDELYNSIKKVAEAAGAGATSTDALGNSAKNATPTISKAAQEAAAMAEASRQVALNTGDASKKVDALSASLGKLPDWFRPGHGSSGGSLFDVPGRAGGGTVSAGSPYVVGERGPELFMPGRSGAILPSLPSQGASGGDTIVIDARGAQVYDGSKFVDLLVRALDQAQRGGRIVQVTR